MSRAAAVLLFALCSGTGAGLATGAIAVESNALRVELPELPGLPELADSLRDPHFHLRRVEFVGLQHLSPEGLARTLDLPRDLPLMDLDVDRLCDAVEAHPRVSSCSGLRVPPDRVTLDVEERVPVARIAESDRGFDADGVSLPLLPGEREDLTRVYGKPEWALPVVRALATRDVDAETVRVRGPRDVTFTTAHGTARVRVGRDLEASLARFDALDRSLLARAGTEEIDLRFAGAAVLRGTRPSGRSEP